MQHFDREQGDQPHHRTHAQRIRRALQYELIVVKTIPLVPESQFARLRVVDGVRDVEEVFEELRRDVFVRGVVLREFECDRHHIERVRRHPARRVGL